MGEGVLAAALAGYYDIPTALVTGSDHACAEMQEWCPSIETVVTKMSLTRYATRCLPLKAVRADIKEAARRAVAGLADHQPLKIQTPIVLQVRWRNNQTARGVALMPGVAQTDLDTTSFVHDDFAEVDRVLKAMFYIAVSPLNAGRVQLP